MRLRNIVRVAVVLAALAGAPASFAAGSFRSSDPMLNSIWNASVLTATNMIVPGPLTTDALGRPCVIDLPTVLIDGTDRDRCPFVGDQAVTGMTLLISTPTAAPVLHDMILWYAQNQLPDGAIPASPSEDATGGPLVLFDYNAYWVMDLYDYVLYTGDLSLARQVWPNLVELMDVWYPAQMGPDGLLANSLGPADYAYIPRAGTTVAYYNAGYVLALRQAAQIATWIGQTSDAATWTARIAPIAATFSTAFWDAQAGAFKDTTAGPVVHPEDGNAFAILAGLATSTQAREALDYLSLHDSQPYGATIADNDIWDGYPWGGNASKRVYPFMSYFEILARYAVGFDASAISLIQREWGYMLANGPGTMWESIGPGGSFTTDPSYDHGWSSGAAPALTNEVLGLVPATPGFATITVAPHPSGLAWANGTIPTPHGTISLAWIQTSTTFTIRLDAPVPGTITIPFAGTVTLDHDVLGTRPGGMVPVPAGSHVLQIRKKKRS